MYNFMFSLILDFIYLPFSFKCRTAITYTILTLISIIWDNKY